MRIKVRKYFIFLIKYLLTREIFFPITVIYVKSNIKNLYQKKDNSIKVLALHSFRYLEDLNQLNIRTKLEVLEIKVKTFQIVNILYFSLPKVQGNSHQRNIEKLLKSEEDKKLFNYQVNFIAKLIRTLYKKRVFDAITSCNFSYKIDQIWQIAAAKANVPFIPLHKECMKDEIIIDEMTQQYKNYCYPLYGKKISIHNKNEKKCLMNSGIAIEKQIEITGCARTDPLFEKFNEKKFTEPEKYITLFSFRHLLGGYRVPEENDNHGFVINHSAGAKKYFEKTHAAFAEMAIRNPSWQFIIKPKFETVWNEYIIEAIEKNLLTSVSEIHNLEITTSYSAQELIKKSRLIFGVNSTAIQESRLEGRPVIIPFFDEATHIHKDRVYFQRYFDKEFIKAASPKEMIEIGECIINENWKPIIPEKDIFIEFLGYTDGKSSKRIEELFIKECKNDKITY